MENLPKTRMRIFGNSKRSRYVQSSRSPILWVLLGIVLVVVIVGAIVLINTLKKETPVPRIESGENTEHAWNWTWKVQDDGSLQFTLSGEQKQDHEWKASQGNYFIDVTPLDSEISTNSGEVSYSWSIIPRNDGAAMVVFEYEDSANDQALIRVSAMFINKDNYVTAGKISYEDIVISNNSSNNGRMTWKESDNLISIQFHDDTQWRVRSENGDGLCSSGPGRTGAVQEAQVWGKKEGTYSLTFFNADSGDICIISFIVTALDDDPEELLITVADTRWEKEQPAETISIDDLLAMDSQIQSENENISETTEGIEVP